MFLVFALSETRKSATYKLFWYQSKHGPWFDCYKLSLFCLFYAFSCVCIVLFLCFFFFLFVNLCVCVQRKHVATIAYVIYICGWFFFFFYSILQLFYLCMCGSSVDVWIFGYLCDGIVYQWMVVFMTFTGICKFGLYYYICLNIF